MPLFSAQSQGDGLVVPYEGKVFEAGDYPDKAFSLTESELDDLVQQFEGVDLDLEHSPFQDLLGHRLGRLESLWRDGANAMGRLAIPRWLHDLAGGRLQTSLTFNAAKSIVGCALTLNPRIPDAEVFAAFTLAHPNLSGPDNTNFNRKEISPMATSLKERLRVLFTKAPDAVREAGIDPAELDQASMPIDNQLEAELTAFRATTERLIVAQLNGLAYKFADEAIQAAKAVPAQREALASLYKSAALADGKGWVQFSESGGITTGPNLQALHSLFENAPTHTLFTSQIANADPNGDSQAPDPKVIERLRSATSLGRQTLSKEAS